MTDWYTSDLHFGHERIVELSHRPFETVAEMDDALVYNWNAVVRPADRVFVLGDVALSRTGLAHVSRLHGIRVLVAGNHDSCWAHHKRWRRALPWYMEAGFGGGVASDGHLTGARLGPHRVNLAHLPYRGAGDHTVTERYAEHRLEDDGLPLLCGHVHDAWKTKRTAAGTLMVNVGVDVWDYTPVSAGTLIEMLETEAKR
jgi:calcineurin-like phosphoesterase family protein